MIRPHRDSFCESVEKFEAAFSAFWKKNGFLPRHHQNNLSKGGIK